MGKMSKRSEVKEDDGDTGRIGRLDEHTMGYYRRVSDKIQEGFENGDEQDMFLRNVFTELSGSEIKLSQNQTVSRILETILPLSSREQLTSFLQGLTSDLSTSSTDRFASHVLQSALVQALNQTEEDGAEDLRKIYCAACAEMLENFSDVMLDTYASHVLRSLIACLAGIQVADHVSRSKLSRGQQHRQLVLETKVILSSPPEDFRMSLEAVSDAAMNSDQLKEYFVSDTAVPVLEVLLLALQHTNQDQCQKLARLFLKQAKLLSKKSSVQAEDTEKPLPPLMSHPISSHLLDVIIKVIDDDLLVKVIRRSFEDQLLKIALHGVANFVLQRLLERTRKHSAFEQLFDKIIPELESVLAVSHFGVIQRLAAGCIDHTSKQVPFLQALLKAFHCYEPKERQNLCIPLFAGMVTYETMFGEKDDSKETLTPPVIQLQGSLLLQEMLKFTKNGTLLNSLLTTPTNILVSMATHPSGSHLLEAFMKSSVIGEKKKDQFVDKLKESYFDLACSKHGSRTVEGIFHAASLKSKFVMAESLAERETHLMSHPFGRYVHRNLSLGHFRTRRQEWKSIQMKQAQKRKLFADIVGLEPAKKEKMSSEERKVNDIYSQEFSLLTGSARMDAQEDTKEAYEQTEGDEITAIFQNLDHHKSKSTSADDDDDQTISKKRKKKKKKKKVDVDSD